ncbi:HDL476Cp [Eremothecium sinecaudum]|uniref:ethanolamine-phosphate cytidylyltransferase n=1 Tax=Eremothecium sinecaudum TaxID=45286 RepID=A0A109UZ56_9SACH|nr:HDL476Cp [Eremothecium sinecaudum]AMD20268.1 HDL476Cp [Eremothecium sinecaudum]
MSQLSHGNVWIDGCFDFTHHGHAAAALQAKRTIPCDEEPRLICGVHNDREIEFNKGANPVMAEEERYEHIASLRWVNLMVKDAPYVTQPAVLDEFGCPFVVHGDDITRDAHGNDCYQEMKDLGRFKVVKRTIGVSTTDIIHRILTNQSAPAESPLADVQTLELFATAANGFAPWCWVFDGDLSQAVVKGGFHIRETDSVYVEGDFDLFNAGHIERLQKVLTLYPGHRVVVGVQQTTPGEIYMSYKERVLSVLSCKYVDAVVVNPSSNLSAAFTQSLNILDSHLCGKRFHYLSKNRIIARIAAERDRYIQRNKKKGVVL